MLGKYDFSKENIKKVYDFFIPLLEIVKINFDYFINILEENNLRVYKVKEIYNKLENSFYFDEFQEIRDQFSIYVEELELEILNLERKQIFINKLTIFLYPIQIKEIIFLIDELVKTSYENINILNKDVLTLKQVIELSYERITYFVEETKGLYLSNILKISSKFEDILLNFNQKEELSLLEIKLENLSFELENKINNIYHSDFSILWAIFIKIQKISAILSIISMLKDIENSLKMGI